MELIDLKAELRQGKGKSHARALRKNNAVPAALYGAKLEPLKLSIATNDLEKIIRIHGSAGVFFNLATEGDTEKSRTVMLKEVQMDTFNLKYLHVDFQEIDMDETVTISVPVQAVGKSTGVEEGGVLQIIRRELDVVCRPADVPDMVSIDISALGIGDAVHVNEIDLGENVKIPYDVEFTVLTIVPPTAEAEVEEEEGIVEEGAEEGAEESAEEGAEESAEKKSGEK